MDILSRVAEVMQGVLTEAADIIGRETGFIKRLRKLSGSSFVQTLVFGWLINGVHIQDSSTVVLPDELAVIWTGCGGSTSQSTSSSVKIHLRRLDEAFMLMRTRWQIELIRRRATMARCNVDVSIGSTDDLANIAIHCLGYRTFQPVSLHRSQFLHVAPAFDPRYRLR
jgi:hypothetical protein